MGSTGRSATCLANSTMLRGLVKNWASAIEAFGNLVSFLTEIAHQALADDAGLAERGRDHGQVAVQRGVVGP